MNVLQPTNAMTMQSAPTPMGLIRAPASKVSRETGSRALVNIASNKIAT